MLVARILPAASGMWRQVKDLPYGFVPEPARDTGRGIGSF